MCFASAKPEAIVRIQVTDIAHAMPIDRRVRAMGCQGIVANLVHRVLVGAGNIRLCHHGTLDHQLSDGTRRDFAGLIDVRQWSIGDFDDAPTDPGKAIADTSSLANAC